MCAAGFVCQPLSDSGRVMNTSPWRSAVHGTDVCRRQHRYNYERCIAMALGGQSTGVCLYVYWRLSQKVYALRKSKANETWARIS